VIDARTVAAALGPLRVDSHELRALCDSLARRPRPAMRINLLGPALDSAALSFVSEPVAWYRREAYFVAPEARPGRRIEFAAGAYYVQDAGSLLPVALLDPQPGEVICDLCASPGGKATAIVEHLGEEGFLLANEAVADRLPPLRLNLARHGGWRYGVSNLDPSRLAEELPETFDAVLVDAPCSGQSLLSRGQKGGGAFAGRTIEHCAARQRRILAAAARLVRPGGRLVYSTCTFSFVENEGLVLAFLAEHAGEWSLAGGDGPLHLRPYRATDVSPHGCYRLWPHRDGCLGAFAALLRRADGVPAGPSPRTARNERPPSGTIDFAEWGFWRSLPRLTIDAHQAFERPAGSPNWAGRLCRGPEVCFRSGRTWFPSYALAMRRDGRFTPHRVVELSESQAAGYLAGRALKHAARGWAIVAAQGLALGWSKGSEGTLKNHLPASARVMVSSGQ